MPNPWDKPKEPSAVQKSGQPWEKYSATTDEVAGAGPGGVPSLAAHPTVDMQPSLLGKDTQSNPVGDYVKGAGKGILHTISSADQAASRIPGIGTRLVTPIGQEATPENAQHAMVTAQALAEPHNAAQRAGRISEQAGEFLLPSGLEEAAGKAVLPLLGRAGEVGAKMVGAGVHNGLINDAQGGGFLPGAVAGAAGSGVGQGVKAVAPILAENALGIRASDRAYGRTPGQAILNETTGFNPGKIAEQAGQKVNTYSNELEDAALNSPHLASLAPARQAVQNSASAAMGRNNIDTIRKVAKMGEQLDTDAYGQVIPNDVSPSTLLHLKRGIGDLQTSWNPATSPKWISGQVGNVYHALDSELDRTVPESSELNQKISTLLPVSARAGAADLNAGAIQRGLSRLTKPTGALAPALMGAGYGGMHGGAMGALLGGGAGLIGTELLGSPAVQMGLARGADSPIVQRLIPAATGAALQLNRPKLLTEGAQ